MKRHRGRSAESAKKRQLLGSLSLSPLLAFESPLLRRCYPCAHGAFSGCATTNASAEQEALYGNKTAALFGYSHLTGGVPGGQVGEPPAPTSNHPS